MKGALSFRPYAPGDAELETFEILTRVRERRAAAMAYGLEQMAEVGAEFGNCGGWVAGGYLRRTASIDRSWTGPMSPELKS
jgi:hypothetical protein